VSKAPAVEAARPFVKWAGGKRFVASALDELGLLPGPGMYKTYVEPFVGGGALFFRLRPSRALLNDANEELIRAYRAIKEDVGRLTSALAAHEKAHNHVSSPDQEAYYYSVRAQDPRFLAPVERAARFIYLNRTCFNGLYRVNSKGVFNVPIGRYANPTICDPTRLQAAHYALQGASLRCGDFRLLGPLVERGDFVYCDPPYVPVSATANFTSYTADSFSETDQHDLALLAGEWAERGAKVLLSNSDAPSVRKTYKRAGFQTTSISVPRAINSNGARRGRIAESVFFNYDPVPRQQRLET